MTSTQVKVNRALSVPPMPFDLPLAANHRVSVTIAPPSAHIGPAPVQMRLISYDLREGQVLVSLFCSRFSGTLSLHNITSHYFLVASSVFLKYLFHYLFSECLPPVCGYTQTENTCHIKSTSNLTICNSILSVHVTIC